MKLKPGERSILASFRSGPQAEKAVSALQEAGFVNVQMDRVGAFGNGPIQERTRPALAGKESSLVDAVLEPARSDDDTAILMGATTEASGMAGAPSAVVPPFLVTLVTIEQRVQHAVAIMERHGGRV